MKRTALNILLCILLGSHLYAQGSGGTVFATQTDLKIVLDGKLNEPSWQQDGIENFTQREPNLGQPSSEKTTTVVLYDNTDLYFGVWCYMKSPNDIRAKFMQRDFDYNQDDVFGIAISTFNDKRNGYLFVSQDYEGL